MKALSTFAFLFLAASACQSHVSRPHLPLATFRYDTSAPLDLASRIAGGENGVETRVISYASPPGSRATGFLWVLSGPGPFAGIVLQHGMPSRAQDMTREAHALARRGAVVIAIDAPWARRGGAVLSWTPSDSGEQVQLIVDLQRAVDVLLERDDVDSARLAYVGVSYGGAMGGLFAGVERRLVLRVGDGGLVAHFTGAEDPPIPEGLSQEQWNRWRAAMDPIEPVRFIANATPASIYFQSGEQDRLVPPADARVYHAAAENPKTVSRYPAGHGLDAEANADMIEWLVGKVGLK